MRNLVTLYRPPQLSRPQRLSALVIAASGGAGSTTTAYGLATALRLGAVCEVALVDATSDGGNLLARTGSGAVDQPRVLRPYADSMAVTSSGVVVVGADEGPLPDPALADELLDTRGSARIHDAGTAMRAPRMIRLIDSGLPVVLTAPARAEPLARLRDTVRCLASAYGTEFLKEVVVVLSHQTPSVAVDLTRVRESLTARTAGVVEVPFDPALAQAGALDHARISPATLNAWTDVLDLLAPIVESPHSGDTDTNDTSTDDERGAP